MKAIKCTLYQNTRWGYDLPPIECESIREALRIAKEGELPYKIYVGNKLVRRGWFV